MDKKPDPNQINELTGKGALPYIAKHYTDVRNKAASERDRKGAIEADKKAGRAWGMISHNAAKDAAEKTFPHLKGKVKYSSVKGPKYKAEDIEAARAAHAKAKELEDKGHEAERMGDQKKMRQTFAAMVQQKLKSKQAMKEEEDKKPKSNVIHCSQCGKGFQSSEVTSPYHTGFSHCKDHKKLGVKMVKEAAEPKPKSMVPQAKQDLKKTKELYKKVDAISKEMKNPGYDVNDRVNHFRLKKHIHDLYVKKRQGVASKAMNEEVELAEAGQDRDYHEFWAGRTSRRISLLKKSGKPIPEDLLRKLEKHRSALQKIRSGKEKQVAAEGVDFATAKSDRGNIKTYTKYVPQKDGSSVVKLIKRRAPRGEIKIGEAIDKTNMMQASIDKMVKMDPLAPKEKIKLPPSQGLKSIGGEDQVHPNMAEEKLNRLYESLSDKNKVKFMEKLETEEGIEQLLRFAEDQGF